MDLLIFLIIGFVIIFILAYRFNSGGSVYKYVSKQASFLYDKYAPYSFKEIREKVKDLGQEYTKKQYTIQITVFAVSAAIISYLYFYNILISLIYALVSVMVIPYLTYLRCKRVYS